MIYMITLYLLQFLTVGAMFVTIMIFYDQVFELLLVEASSSVGLKELYENGILRMLFFVLYLGMIFLSTFVSISLPIDRAIGYFRVIACILGVLIITSLVGIIFFLAKRGFNPNIEICEPLDDPENCDFVAQEETYFSMLTVAGVIMLCVYALPFVMRPLDFLANAKHYFFGFLAYMLMLPVFTNLFQIYAMCNLHDVSWGNRPTSTGQEAFTANKQAQLKSESDYKVFRTNFVLFWLAANAGYYIMIVELVNTADGELVRDSDNGYLAAFSLYLAALVAFRVVFATLHICKWKYRYNLTNDYKVHKRNMLKDFKEIKQQHKDGESTDDEFIESELQKVYEQNKNKIENSVMQSAVETTE